MRPTGRGKPSSDDDARVESLERRLLLHHAPAPFEPDPVSPESIGVPDPQGLVFDERRRHLLIPTAGGKIYRYDEAAGASLTPWDVGTSLRGADVSPDAEFLYAGEEAPAGPTGAVYKVRLDDGVVVRTFTYPLAENEAGVRSLVATRDGVYFTGRSTVGQDLGYWDTENWGAVPLRKLDPDNGSVSVVRNVPIAPDGLTVGGYVARSADRGVVVFADDSGTSRYDVAAGRFRTTVLEPRRDGRPTWYPGADLAVSRDGGAIALDNGVVIDREMRLRQELTYDEWGPAFHPERDLMYVFDLVSVDSSSYTIIYAYAAGTTNIEDWMVVHGPAFRRVEQLGNYQVVGGNHLFAIADGYPIDSVLKYRIATAPDIEAGQALSAAGQPVPFTVTARLPRGVADTNYRGTVRVSSSDPGAFAPFEYTFTADDRGQHKFVLTFATGGAHRVTVTEVDNGLSATSGEVVIDADGPTAALSPATPVAGAAVLALEVTYEDPNGVASASLGEDLVVVGPGGVTLPARLLGSDLAPTAGATRVVARYEIDAPGGRWDPADAGEYAVRLNVDAVRDGLGTPAPAEEIGRFTADLPAAAPDLAAAVSVPRWPRAPRAGDEVPATVVVTNTGPVAPSGAFEVEVYASADGLLDPSGGDVLLGRAQFPLGAVPPGGQGRLPVRLKVPALPRGGVFQLLTKADATRAVAELDETNNVIGAGKMVLMPATEADVVVTVDPPLPPTQARVGGVVVVRVRLLNLGSKATRGGFGVQLLRPYGDAASGPPWFREMTVGRRVALRPGEAKVATFRLKLRRNIWPRDYVLVAGFGPAPGFGDADEDNSAVGGPLRVTT